MSFRGLIKKRLPFLIPIVLLREYLYDYSHFLRFSGIRNYKNSENALIYRIMEQCHVLEKGLTMPETRLGFGVTNILLLIENCKLFITRFGGSNVQLQHAIAVLQEYHDFHATRNFEVSSEIIKEINNLSQTLNSRIPIKQIETTNLQYFNEINNSFDLFSASRKSIRNFSPTDIPDELIIQSVDLSRNAPSSCNRQAVKANVISDKSLILKILEIQGGSRGFGNLTNKLIVVTADLAICHGASEKHQVYVDGGMFAMNLLYALHQNKIATCALNCNFTKDKDKKLRRLIQIPESEVFVVMFSCGFAPESFKIALSKRNPVKDYIRFL